MEEIEAEEEAEMFADEPTDTEDDEEDQDPPPVIPEGLRAAEVVPTPLVHFVIWSQLTRNDRAAWRTGTVTKTYPAGYTYRGSPYTHDAELDSNNQVRGVNLTAELREQGHWVPIERIPVQPQPEEPRAPAPAANARPRRARN